MKQIISSKFFWLLTASLLLIQGSPAHASGGITPDSALSSATLSGDVDVKFRVDQPRKGSFDFICLSMDGNPIEKTDELFLYTRVTEPGFGPSESYGYNYSDKPRPNGGCINVYSFSTASEQNQIEIVRLKTGYLQNGPHTLGVNAIYGDGTSVQGQLQFVASNTTKLLMEWDGSLQNQVLWGRSVALGGVLGKSSEVPPTTIQIRTLQGGQPSKWTQVSTESGSFHQKNLKIASKTEIQVQFKMNGENRVFSKVVEVMPVIQISASNLYVLKKSKTTIRVLGLKTGMCQLNVDWGYDLYKTYPVPLKNGIATQYFTFNSMGVYSGNVTCSGKGFVAGVRPFNFRIALG